jgi:NAD(P)-dependent dehydrogenase (short-subunit alcohol dehydrogenase family)
MKDLENRVALVTGGSRGIGAGIAVALAKAGANVAVNYRERADAAEAVCGEIRAIGRKASPVHADVSISADVKRMIAEVETSLGGIDILVNNAAIAHPRKLEEITEAEWDEMLTVNLKSVFLVTQAAIRRDAKTEVGPDHQPVFRRGTNRRGCRSALRRIEGRNHRADTFVRLSICPRWHHGQCHRSRPD